LLGPNGSGKTTLINCILSLLEFDKGSVKIYGEEMTPESYHIKEKIGVVFQDVGVFEELTVYENIDYFCSLYIKDKDKRKKYVEDAIELVGLSDFKKFVPKKLSGGLLRRLNIACGIAHKPEIIILDEPTVAVDPQSRNNILEGIKKLNKEGATVIYTSHYMEEIDLICDYIVILDKGKVVAKGTSEELKESIEIDEKIKFETKELPNEALKEIEGDENILEVTYKDSICEVTYKNGNHNLINLVKILNKYDVDYESINLRMPTLNDVFLELTGKDLRD
ncbi:MAG TPA: ABC transporter ATP-binding protein, partial [Candidatus Dojkabacteria bacterium]|nr:ABC transporter ATP-binding protein [Candidatus Dojkabacteria bacterium]